MQHLLLHLPQNILKRAASGMFKMKGILGLSSLLAFSSTLSYAQVTVTATAGSSNTSYATVNAAFTAINAGTHQGAITITVTGNTTEPATPVPLLRSSSPSSYTSVLIKPAGNVTINSAATPITNRGILELLGADNVTIDGDDPATAGSRNLSIVAATSTVTGVACIKLSSNSTTGADGADNATIKNCMITGSRNSATSTAVNYGIHFSNGSAATSGAYSSVNTLIQNNLITRTFHGIYAHGVSNTYPITGLQILSNVFGTSASGYSDATSIGSRAISVAYTATASSGGAAIIRNNDIRGGGDAGYLGFVVGVYIDTENYGLKIEKNNIHDLSQPSSSGFGPVGLYFNGTSDAVSITNNFLSNFKGYTYSTSMSTWNTYGIDINSTATNIKIDNNSIAINGTYSGTTANTASACIVFRSATATAASIRNNILLNTANSTAAYGIYCNTNANILTATVNNNCFYVPTGRTGYYNGAALTSLGAWQTASGKDVLSINENPPFISATDLHIPAGSNTFLESGGTGIANTGVTTDIDGQTRPGASSYGLGTAPDIGADEFDGRAICAPLVATNTTANQSGPICNGQTLTFSLSAAQNTFGIRYQWQSSHNGTTYTNIANAVNNTYTTPVTAKFYRCKIYCSNSLDSILSTPYEVQTTLNILSSTAAQRCGPGTLTLAATGSPNGVVRWFGQATGGIALGTGNNFVTPPISTTTNFYAEASIINPGTSTVGAGASTGNAVAYNPLQGGYGGLKGQYIFTATELNNAGLSAGNINSIALDITSAGATLNGFTVAMSSTALSSFPDNSIQAVPTIVAPSAAFVPTVGINTITFTTPFAWDGVANLILSISWSNNNTGNTNSSVRFDATANPMSLTYRKDDETAPNMLAFTGATGAGISTFDRTSNRPKVIFGGITACNSTRTEVTATINTAPPFTVTNDKTVCNNAITPLTVSSTQSSYNNVTWNPVAGLFTDAAATVPYVANTHAYTVYHKSNVAGSENYIATAQNTTTLCGGIDTVKIQVLPAAINAVASPGTLCLTGSSVIKMNPVIPQSGALYQWQSSTDNLNFTNTGSVVSTDTFSTGTLTATRYFRAIVKNSDNTTCFNSGSDTVLVSNPVVSTTIPGTRCGYGTVILGATTPAGNSLNWFNAATGGNLLGTGTSFTSPPIATSTNYWVEAVSTSLGNSMTAKIGNGTSLTAADEELTAFCNRRSSYKMQMIYTRAELNAMGFYGGNLNGIGFDITTMGDGATNSAFTVKVGSTTQNTFSAYITTGLNTTYGPLTYTHAVGNNMINFSSPYIWDGASNIVLEITHNGLDDLYNAQTYYTTTSGNMTGYSYDQTTTATTTNKRLNTTFLFSSLCSSPRQQVTATVTPAPAFDITNDKTVCNNAVTTLTATTGGSSYDNVTWTPVANLYTNATATTAYVAGTHATTVYYKNGTPGITTITANANNTATSCANIDTVKIQTLPAAITALATPGILCESGTSSLNYTPLITQTGFIQQWGNATDNINFTDINGATGSSYSTPTLNNTQYYRISIKNSDGAVCMSSSDTVRVLHPGIALVNAAQRCGPGSVTLSVTAVDGATTWYSSTTGGTILGTGTSFTTPSLNNTTNYYVGVSNMTNDTFAVGNGGSTSSTYPNPFYSLWSNTHNQYLIPASELLAAGLMAGNITSLAIRITSGTTAMQEFSVKMAHTNVTNMSAFVSPAFTTVYTAATQTPVVGLNTLNFTTPFAWDGSSNVVIEICHGNASSSATMSSTAVVNTTSYVSTIHAHKSTSSAGNATCTEVTNALTTYSVRPRFTFRGEFMSCGTATRTQVTATINPKPTAGLSPTGNINLCNNDVELLTATGGGTYSWLRNGTIIPGQSNATLSVSQTNPYSVVVTATNGCKDTSATANIIVQPDPVVFLGNDTAYCGNVPYTLNAGNAGATFLWNDNSTAGTLNVLNPGQYAVTVTNNYNCSSSDTINIIHYPYPIVNLGDDTSICRLQPLVLDAANTGSAYIWNNNANTQTISVNQAGTYSVTVTNGFNCVGKDTINVSIQPIPDNYGFDFEPLFNIHPGRVRFTPINLNPAYTYQWNFGDNSTSNVAISTHDYLATGVYNVILTATDGCTDSIEQLEISVDLYTNVVKVNKAAVAVKVYPNPTRGVLNVVLESEDTYINKLSIFNIIGQNITTIVPAAKNTKQQEIYLNNLASGTYLIKIETDKGTVSKKFEFTK